MAQGQRRGSIALALSLTVLCVPAVASGFVPGEVYWVPGFCGSSCGMFEMSAGGDQQGASPFAATDRSPGQIAWEAAPLRAYLTQFDSDSVVRVDSAGAVTTFATGIAGATGLLLTSGGALLAVSFSDAAVYEIGAGGDFSGATPFASGFGGPRNLIELSDGTILLADQTRRAVYDISAGGDFSQATPFASDLPYGPLDLVEDEAGRIFVSTDNGVFDISAGGSFLGATPHATGRTFAGLTLDTAGRLLASDLDSGEVFDISAGGDYTSSPPFAWNLEGFGDSALDTVPGATSAPPVPALDGIGTTLLGGLLVATGARRLRRRRS